MTVVCLMSVGSILEKVIATLISTAIITGIKLIFKHKNNRQSK